MGPPHFSPEIFFNKITQNGLKWILNTTLKSEIFGRGDPPTKNKCHTLGGGIKSGVRHTQKNVAKMCFRPLRVI